MNRYSLTKQLMDHICIDKSTRITKFGDGIRFTDNKGELTHPIINDLNNLNKVLTFDPEYCRYDKFHQCHIDNNGDIVIYDYKLKSYMEISSNNGRCMWLDACNVFKTLALKYDAPYRIMDDIVYTDKTILHQIIDFIILFDTEYVSIFFNEEGIFPTIHGWEYSNDVQIHEPIPYDQAIGISEEIGIEGEKISICTVDITNMQFQDIQLSEFNRQLSSMLY